MSLSISNNNNNNNNNNRNINKNINNNATTTTSKFQSTLSSIFKKPYLLKLIFNNNQEYEVVTLLRYLVLKIEELNPNITRDDAINQVFNNCKDSIEYRDFLLNSFVSYNKNNRITHSPTLNSIYNNNNNNNNSNNTNNKRKRQDEISNSGNCYLDLFSTLKSISFDNTKTTIIHNLSSNDSIYPNSMLGFVLSNPFFLKLIDRHELIFKYILNNEYLFTRSFFSPSVYIQISGIPVSKFLRINHLIKDNNQRNNNQQNNNQQNNNHQNNNHQNNNQQNSNHQNNNHFSKDNSFRINSGDKKKREPSWIRKRKKIKQIQKSNKEKQIKESKEKKQALRNNSNYSNNNNNNHNGNSDNKTIRLNNKMKQSQIKEIIGHSHIFYSNGPVRPFIPNKFLKQLKDFKESNNYQNNNSNSGGNSNKVTNLDSKRLCWYIFSSPPSCPYIRKIEKFPKNIRIQSNFKNNLSIFSNVISKLSNANEFRHILDTLYQKYIAPNNNSSNNFLNIQSTSIDLKSLINRNIPFNIVYKFLNIITSKLFPKSVWGSSFNQKLFNKGLLLFGNFRNGASLKLIEFCNQFNIEEFFLKNREYLIRFIWWIFDEILPQVIKNYFYCTEGADIMSLVYYRKYDWYSLCNIQTENLLYKVYSNVFANKGLFKNRKFGLSKLRFIPKKTNLRPIVNSSSKKLVISVFDNEDSSVKKLSFYESINESLADFAFPILKFEILNDKRVIGSSVFTKNEIYERFKSIREQLNKVLLRKKKLYLISIDITRCYDTINQKKLYSILEETLKSDNYFIQKIMTSISNDKKKVIFSRPLTQSCSLDNLQTFEEAVYNIKTNSEMVAQDLPVYKVISRRRVLNLFYQHIFEHYVKYGSRLLHQKIGIGQGSLCSTHLCSLYLGHLENNLLKPQLLNNDNDDNFEFMIRFIDDYFYVSTSKSNIDTFKNLFYTPVPHDYDVKANPSKTTYFNSSFDHSGIIKRGDYHFIPWCGFLINCENLEVQKNYSNLSNKKTKDYIIYLDYEDFNNKLMGFLVKKISNKALPLLFDPQINSSTTIYINLYQVLLFTAIKFHCFINCIKEDSILNFKSILNDIIINISSIIFKKINLDINVYEMLWLTYYSFYKILIKKSKKYLTLLKELKSKLHQLNLDQNSRHIQLKFNDIVNDDLSIDILNINY